MSIEEIRKREQERYFPTLEEFIEKHNRQLVSPVAVKWEETPSVVKKISRTGTLAKTDELCAICFEKPLAVVFLECGKELESSIVYLTLGHMACCDECSKPLELCCICRYSIPSDPQCPYFKKSEHL